ncbi:MAG TPA: MBOAT family O-acyltransferase [Acetobacteraceae bacterium]|nr:MBOAT family O-acyltransferase [Acetobacteraceae bacterium]
MLFNSAEFLFGFAPIAVVGFYLLGRFSRVSAIRWLIAVSLVFYGWWRPLNVLIIGPSILINFALARVLLRLNQGEHSRRTSQAVLLLGILFNVMFLGVFKYTDFITGTVNDVFGTNFVLLHIILPLGISFITFQKIAFLIDVQAGRVTSFTFQDYCTFVLFFPQLIAGPIVHYREMMPQFNAVSCRFDQENVAVGLTLLLFGLFKKVVLADKIAPLITPIYQHAASGAQVPFLTAWVAAIGFTLQIYFDFSGYTDMALGLARFFGIKLPPNFNSPLRAPSIIDFWLRWHITLTRFLTAYIYNPLVLARTRRRLTKGLPGLGGRNTTVGAFVSLLLFPTILTMFISGLWHGAGYGFVVWGLLNGVYITINHAWRLTAARLWKNRRSYDRFMKPVGHLVTFITVCATMIFFRATTITSAIDLVRGTLGLNGLGLPQDLLVALGPLAGILHGIGVVGVSSSGQELIKAGKLICLLLFIALALPNTLQILDRHEPALGIRPGPAKLPIGKIAILKWNPSLPWAIAISAIAAVALVSIGGPSEFLYWQF